MDRDATPAPDVERRIAGALRGALGWLSENEAKASVLLVDAPTGPIEAKRAQLALFDAIADRLAVAARGPGATVTALDLMLVGGAVGLTRRLAIEEKAHLLPDLAADLTWLVVRPYQAEESAG